jgi:hypothetical protein
VHSRRDSITPSKYSIHYSIGFKIAGISSTVFDHISLYVIWM